MRAPLRRTHCLSESTTVKTHIMRNTALTLLILICVIFSSAAITTSYDSLKTRADRFFKNNEWASAGAYYTFMLEERPDVADTYGRAIVSCMMGGDTITPRQLLTKAMENKVPLDSVLSNVRLYAFAKDSAVFYPRFMLSVARNQPWLARPIDAMLLKYYMQRNDGPMIIRYANTMLNGVPDDTRFLSALAHGYMLTGDYPKALDTWQHILRIAPTSYDTLLQIAAYYASDGKMQEAIPYYEQANNMHPTPFVTSILSQHDPYRSTSTQK